MSDKRPPPRRPSPGWAHTAPGDLPEVCPMQPAAPAGKSTPATRTQPPLQEVIKGLDARELEGQTVFDQLFGVELPPAPPAPAGKKPAR